MTDETAATEGLASIIPHEPLSRLAKQIEAATGPDRAIDAMLFNALVEDGRRRAFKVKNWATLPGAGLSRYHDGWLIGKSDEDQYAEDLPRYTSSLDATASLIGQILPGWAWKVGTCCVSDDAWLVPDFNHPRHGDRLKEEFGYINPGSIWDTGIDIDRRPPGKPELALCQALIEALMLLRSK